MLTRESSTLAAIVRSIDWYKGRTSHGIEVDGRC